MRLTDDAELQSGHDRQRHGERAAARGQDGEPRGIADGNLRGLDAHVHRGGGDRDSGGRQQREAVMAAEHSERAMAAAQRRLLRSKRRLITNP